MTNVEKALILVFAAGAVAFVILVLFGWVTSLTGHPKVYYPEDDPVRLGRLGPSGWVVFVDESGWPERMDTTPTPPLMERPPRRALTAAYRDGEWLDETGPISDTELLDATQAMIPSSLYASNGRKGKPTKRGPS